MHVVDTRTSKIVAYVNGKFHGTSFGKRFADMLDPTAINFGAKRRVK